MTREICEAQMPENEVKLSDMKESRKPPEANTAEIHVLAVDDSVTDRKVIERLLKISSYKVTTVDSGIRALEILGVGGCQGSVNINQISMIITDYCMPGMSGYDLLKRVKEISALKEIPVVIMSSENVPNRIERCLEEGAKEFILKPVRLADVKRLRNHVSEPRQDLVEQPSIPCNKRKFSSEGFPAQSSERRPRLNGLTVA